MYMPPTHENEDTRKLLLVKSRVTLTRILR
jgi:hypothetical protein